MKETKRTAAYIASIDETLMHASFGTCPGCPECMERDGFDSVGYEPELTGLAESVYSWIFWRPYLRWITRIYDRWAAQRGEILATVAHEEAWQAGEISEEGSFSHSGCGVCGSPLGGDRYVLHWIDRDGEIRHEDDGCQDCLMFFSNGDLPEDEYLDWTGELEDMEVM